MQFMNDKIPYMFDCWAYPVFHLLLLKSSIVQQLLLAGDGPWALATP